jgi:hypothetical protein
MRQQAMSPQVCAPSAPFLGSCAGWSRVSGIPRWGERYQRSMGVGASPTPLLPAHIARKAYDTPRVHKKLTTPQTDDKLALFQDDEHRAAFTSNIVAIHTGHDA